LVCIDPYDPFERTAKDNPTPVELAISLALEGFRVFYWYGYDTIEQRGWVCDSIANKVPNGCLWCGDFLVPAPFVYPETSGPWGGGVLLLNSTPKEIQSAQLLSKKLEQLMQNDILDGNDPERLSFASLI
jgi:hypothetical protein